MSDGARLVAAARTLASIGRLHIVAIASLGALTFGWALTGERPWALAAICGLDWFVVNLLNRVVDQREDQLNAIRGTGFVARHRRAVLLVGFGALALSFPLVWLAFPRITGLRVAYHALGLAYNWPLLPGGRRIKALYFFKNAASAAGFLLTVFGYPLLASGEAGGPWVRVLPDVTVATVAVTAAFFFLFELSYEVIYDLRDEAGDRAAGVRSYPVVHGRRGAVRIIDALIVGSVSVLLAGYAAGLVPWRLGVMVFAPALQMVLYKRQLQREMTSAFCVGLTWFGAALLATYHVWVALELPGVEALP